METEHNDLPEWRPDELLEKAAARHGLTVEQFRARVRAVADDARRVSGHVSFEHARDLDLSHEEFMHVERCRFCTDLLRTIHPKEDVVRDFEKLLRERLGRREPAPWLNAILGPVPHLLRSATATIGVGIVVFSIAIGVNMWPRPSPPTVSIASDLPVVNQIVIEQSFANAVQYQQLGKTDIANAFVVKGLATAGLKQPELQLVTSALSANVQASVENNEDLLRAKWHFTAGNKVQGHKDVLTYLKSNEPHSLATKAYGDDFVGRIEKRGAAGIKAIDEPVQDSAAHVAP